MNTHIASTGHFSSYSDISFWLDDTTIQELEKSSTGLLRAYRTAEVGSRARRFRVYFDL